MYRSATSHSSRKIKTPMHFQELQQRKKQLIFRSRKLTGQRTRENSIKNIGTPFKETGTTFHPVSILKKIRSSVEVKKRFLNSIFLDKNQLADKNADKKSIPLQLLRFAKINSLPEQILQRKSSLTQRSTKKFLRKGSAINKAIMVNVLRAKCSKKIVENSNSYMNCPVNNNLSEAIYDQVPLGLHDSIGRQQMLRMSNIFTGGTIQSIDLHKKVGQIIGRYSKAKKPIQTESEEGMTLRSIKRW